jgi:hypothetical protein
MITQNRWTKEVKESQQRRRKEEQQKTEERIEESYLQTKKKYLKGLQYHRISNSRTVGINVHEDWGIRLE